MSLLAGARVLSRPAAVCIREQCKFLFHTSASISASGPKPKHMRYGAKGGPNGQTQPASRTRLAKDLKPKTNSAASGKLRVAPKSRSGPRIADRGPERRSPATFGLRGSSAHKSSAASGSRQPRDTSHAQSERNLSGPSSRREPQAADNAQSERRPSSRREPRPAVGVQSERKPPSFSRDAVPHTGVPEVSRSTDRPLRRRNPNESMRKSSGRPERFSTRTPGRSEWPSKGPSQESTEKTAVEALIDQEFDRSGKPESAGQLPLRFSSPPLMGGLLASIKDTLGEDATPTPIQALTLKHLFHNTPRNTSGDSLSTSTTPTDWKQFLLASETGSGKSIAYFLPLLQYLKQTEGQPQNRLSSPLPVNPRALVLAPTHELSRQLSGFAKALLHNVKLRVVCSSRANVPSTPRGLRGGTASKMAAELTALTGTGKRGVESNGGVEIQLSPQMRTRPVDVLIGTPMKTLEMVRGRGWDKVEERNRVENDWELDEKGKRLRQNKFYAGPPEMGLAEVEYVVIDEADVLFDPDFQETTQALLADISAARGQPIPKTPDSPTAPPQQFKYPFHLILTSATIPSSLAAYLDTHHPQLTRLASPNLHRLPAALRTEHVGWTGGNRSSDIEKRIRRVWAEDALRGPDAAGRRQRSKVLVFCNRSSKVEELGAYLEAQGVANVALTSASGVRARGSNHHIDGFIKGTEAADGQNTQVAPVAGEKKKEAPHVLITTSLLSRGLDFAPSIKHVFIVDSPRNMIDFLHRAGRTGRAGQAGKVVIFGKMKGRGSSVSKDVRRKVGALAY